MDYLNHSYILVCAFVLALGFVPLCAWIARHYGIMDNPDKNLKKHKKAVPYLGGVAIFLAFFLTLVPNQLLSFHTVKGIAGLMIAGGMIFSLGLVDDIKKLSVPFKFSVQILAAVVLVICGMKIRFLPTEGLNIVVTIIWVVGVTNAFNLVDIMDGLSSGVAFIAASAFFILGIDAGSLFSPLASLSLAGACLGFLMYNFNPAKIFMGDAGSLFLGFMLATFSLTENYTAQNNLAVLTPVLILGLPIFDTLFVMWMRAKQGKPVYFGSPDHFPLRLLRAGLPVKHIVVVCYAISISLAVIAYAATKLPVIQAGVLYSVVLIAALYAGVRLSKTGNG